MIQEYLIRKAFEHSFAAAKTVATKILREKRAKLRSKREDIEESLSLHLRAVKNWSAEVSFSDLKEAKRTTDIFIEIGSLCATATNSHGR